MEAFFIAKKGQKFKKYQLELIKEIIDFKISKFNDLKLVMENLNSAIKKTKNDCNEIIIHSDHGSQYTSNIYKNFCSAWHCYINGKSIFLYRKCCY